MQGKNLSYFQLSHLQSVWKKKTCKDCNRVSETFWRRLLQNMDLMLWKMMLKIMLVDLTNVEDGHSKLRGLQDFP